MNKNQNLPNILEALKKTQTMSPFGGASINAVIIPEHLTAELKRSACAKDIYFLDKYDRQIEQELNSQTDELTDKTVKPRICALSKNLFRRYRVSWNAVLDYTVEILETPNV
ncbi:MAG: hypothetical protein LBK68_04695 [Candidatus Margulisbacteria bacterium]|jgi:hypothetical protein|nr:hypothetical protein [Candidatus Margulisiibacteriota bacterium]